MRRATTSRTARTARATLDPTVDLLFTLVMALAVMVHPETTDRGAVSKVAGEKLQATNPQSPVVRISSDHRVTINGTPVQHDQLESTLRPLLAKSNAPIAFEAAPDLPHGDVVRMIDRLDDLGDVLEVLEAAAPSN